MGELHTVFIQEMEEDAWGTFSAAPAKDAAMATDEDDIFWPAAALAKGTYTLYTRLTADRSFQ